MANKDSIGLILIDKEWIEFIFIRSENIVKTLSFLFFQNREV